MQSVNKDQVYAMLLFMFKQFAFVPQGPLVKTLDGVAKGVMVTEVQRRIQLLEHIQESPLDLCKTSYLSCVWVT